MRRLLSLKDVIFIISLSIILSQISWWVLFTTKKAHTLLNPEIAQSLESAQTVTIASLPSNLILPLIAYFPFWSMAFTFLRIFINLEKRRFMGSPIQQQTL